MRTQPLANLLFPAADRASRLLICVLLAALVLAVHTVRADDQDESQDDASNDVAGAVEEQEPESGPAIPITISEVRNEDLDLGVPAAGTVFSRNAAQITAGLNARLVWVAEPGDRIEAGEPVARFDCAMITLRRDEQLAQADRERVRFESLGREIERLERARMATSELQLERVKADRDLALGEMQVVSVRVSQTDNELRRCVEPAPFSGVVTQQFRRGGEDATRGDVLAAMTDIHHLEVRASVPIRHLPRMRTGTTAEVRMNDMRFDGLVRTVVPAADAASQTFEVRIDLPLDAPQHVAAGQLVSVNLPLSTYQALTVPRDSIVLRQEGAFVMRIASDNTAQSVSVEVADGSGETVSIRGDLQPGDRVAVRGAEALDDGERVAILSGP
jgi:RND family efflux transporter MFP subunit